MFNKVGYSSDSKSVNRIVSLPNTTFDVSTVDDDERESKKEGPYCRTKEDIFHKFKDLPLSKCCTIISIVQCLLIHATFIFNENDFEELAQVLVEKFGFTTKNELYNHFFFNKEYWRERVRMVTPPAEQHASNIRKIKMFFEDNEIMNEYYDKDVEDYFSKFEDKARRGLFDEIEDVSLFRFKGVDSNSLTLWHCLISSTRAENLHQHMFNCIGPHAVGAEVARYLIVLLAFRYNISTGISRCNHPDHGHMYLNLIDRIQICTQQLHNILLYPNHPNVSLFKPVKNFVAVGIGPLSYNEDYVDIGLPHKELKGEVKFIAK